MTSWMMPRAFASCSFGQPKRLPDRRRSPKDLRVSRPRTSQLRTGVDRRVPGLMRGGGGELERSGHRRGVDVGVKGLQISVGFDRARPPAECRVPPVIASSCWRDAPGPPPSTCRRDTRTSCRHPCAPTYLQIDPPLSISTNRLVRPTHRPRLPCLQRVPIPETSDLPGS